MGEDDTTTVKLKRDTWKELNSKKEPGDSFDDVIQRLIDEEAEGNPTGMTPETTAD